jgi:uncharacterized protein (TIGR03084 family)
MSSNTDHLLTDLVAEMSALDEHLSAICDDDWSIATPAPGWNVADQVIHLGLVDRRAIWSMVDPERFDGDIQSMMSAGGMDAIHDAERSQTPAQLLAWWREGAADLVRVAQTVDLAARCRWYGPSMSGTSMLTARLMETWAHGYDIADALGWKVEPTDRLKHIAHIGVRAMPFAFSSHKLEPPDGNVRVCLTGPFGDEWTWGHENASSSVTGTAIGFCLAVTQRRHIDDCGLTMVGEPASTWMPIAQSFAGPPGAGRVAGQFA